MMWYWLPVYCGIGLGIAFIVSESRRAEVRGRAQIEAWAKRNGFAELRCSFHDCSYVRGRSWRGLKMMAFFNIRVRTKTGAWRQGFAVCILSTGDVTVRWARG